MRSIVVLEGLTNKRRFQASAAETETVMAPGFAKPKKTPPFVEENRRFRRTFPRRAQTARSLNKGAISRTIPEKGSRVTAPSIF